MRATISFEADVSRVNDIMRSLVLEESNALQDALNALEKATADRTVEGISEALGHIYGVASQLEQYRQMMVSFEKARFETIVPRSVDGVLDGVISSVASMKEDIKKLKDFDNFVDKMNEGATKNEEVDNGPEKR